MSLQESTDALAIKDPVTSGLTAVANLLGTLTGTVDGTINDVAAAACAGGATPTAAQVDTAIDSLEASTNLALKELHVKLNELIDALQAKNMV